MANNKQYYVNMKFNADTSAAQSQVQKLQSSLSQVANMKISVQGGNLDKAAQSAKILGDHLARATNMSTGKLDFSALQHSLKSANTDLTTLTGNLLAAGPKGQQAFSQVASAVASAELSTKKANTALQKFGNTLMNTIRWQASSMLIQGVTKSVTDAVRHIEELDKSLTNIKIVSGKNTDEMAKFAKQANLAAKELKATTTEYTNASLIYFQQGLGEKAVAERTKATLKMAKVTGDSVETVSSQLTAVWNNFDNGTKSLESYADVLAALGAATASSTSEISDGLQKFASIAETTGLSYEYAATALATVTAQTRQSADTVGTAFKTLFARIQGLQLGDTLDDGTTLNKYSQALAKVGIDIKAADGELKDMNSIFDEMGAKWKSLSSDTQVALAQSVAGVRQYTQLVALMDNWDQFKKNLSVAEGSEGTLDKQFNAYKDSIEAADKELQNVKESLYQDILNPKLLQGFKEALTDIFETISKIIENAGGIEEVLKFGGLMIATMLLPKLGVFLTQIKDHFMQITGLAQNFKIQENQKMAAQAHAVAGTKEAKTMKDFSNLRKDVFSGKGSEQVSEISNTASASDIRLQMNKESNALLAEELDKRSAIMGIEEGMTAAQKEQFQQYMEGLKLRREALSTAREELAVAKETQAKINTTSSVAIKRSGAASKEVLEEQTNIRTSNKKNEIEAEYSKKQQEDDAQYAEEKSKITQGKKKLSKEDKTKLRELKQQKKEKDSEREAEKGAALQQAEKENVVTSRNVDLTTENSQSTELSKTLSQEGGEGSVTADVMSSLTPGISGEGVAVSQENLEKLGSTQAQLSNDIGIANDLYAEMGAEISKMGDSEKSLSETTKSQLKSQKELDASLKSQKQLGKEVADFTGKYEKQFAAAAKESKDLESALKKIKDNGKDFSLGDLNQKELKAVQGTMKNVKSGIEDAADATAEMSQTMSQDMAEATDVDVKVFDDVVEGARKSEEATINQNKALEDSKKAVQIPIQGDPFGTFTQGLQQTSQAITGLAMGYTMFSNGFKLMTEENASMTDKLTGAMMLAQGAMSILNGLQAAGNLIKTIGTAITIAKTAAENKESVGIFKAIGLMAWNTAVTIANAVAKIFNAEATKGLAGVILAVLAVGIMVATIAIINNTIATNKDTKAKQDNAAASDEQAKGSQKAAEAAKKEMEQIKSLTDAYEEALKTYEKTGEGKAELIDAGANLVNSMQVEGAAALLLAGKYEELANKAREAAKEKAKIAVNTAATSMEDAGTRVQASAKKNEKGLIFETGKGKNGDKLQMAIDLRGYSADAVTVLKEFLDSSLGDDYRWEVGNNWLWVNYDEPREVGVLLQELDSLKTEATAWAIANKKNLDFATAISGALEVDQDAVDAAKQATTDWGNTSVTSAQTMYMHNVSSQSDYNEKYEQAVKYLETEAKKIKGKADRQKWLDERIAELNKQLAESDTYGQFEVNRQGLEETLNSSNSEVKEWVESGKLKEWAKNNSYTEEEALSLFLKISPQLITDEGGDGIEDDIDEALQLMQDYLDGERIIAKWDLISGAKSSLKETMTSSDWSDFKEKNKDLFDPESSSYIGMSFEEFASKSYNEQKKILNEQQGNKVAGIDKQISANEEKLQGLKDTGKEEYNKQVANEVKNKYENLQLEGEGTSAAVYFDNKNTFTDAFLGGKFSGQVTNEITQEQYDALSDAEKIELDNFYKTLGFEGFADFAQKRDEYKNREINAEKAYDTEVEATEKAIQSGKDEKFIAELEEMDLQIEQNDLDTEEVYEAAEAFEKYGGSVEGVSKNLAGNEKQSKKAAIVYKKQEKDLLELQEGWEGITEILSDSTSSDLEKAKAYDTINKSLYSLLGTSDEFQLSSNFISKNFDLIQKVLEGDEAALEELKEKSSEEIVLNITGKTSMEEVDEELKNKLGDIKNYAKENGLQFGDIIDSDDEDAMADFQAWYTYLADTAGWSAEAIKTYFKDAGYEIDVVDGKINSISYFDTSKILLDSEEIKNSAKELAKTRAEEAKSARDRARSLEDEIDYYRTINELIDDLSKEMDKLSKKKDQAYGKNKLAYMDAELKGYEAQIEAQDKLMEQAQDIKDLNYQRLIDMDLGLNFDENNNITNYNDIQAKMAQELANMDEESAEYVLAEERYELFKQYAENYEEAVDTYEDAVIEKTDLEIAKLDAKLESIQYSIEMKIDVNDTELKKLEFLMTQLDDPVADSVEILNNTANSISAHMDNIKTYTNGIKEILKTAGATDLQAQAYLGGDYSAISNLELTERQVEDITSLSENVMSEQQNILDGAASIEESIMTVFDGYIEKFDEVASKTDSYNSVVDSYKNMIDIVGKDTLGISDSLINSMEQASINAASTKIKNAKASLDFVNESLAKAQAERAKYADGTEEAEYWDNQIEILSDKALEKQTELVSEMENGFQKAADRLASALEKAFEKLEDGLAGTFDSLDELMNNFDREQKLADMYLDNGEKLYNISKLNRQIQKDIDNTDNVKAKQELAKLQADINKYSAEGTKMSQKDLEALQKKYDLKLAEIALEEAQKAKSQVRMTRDSEGNWSYTYTADQNQIDQAQQKYDDELEANRQLTLETDKEITSQIIENRQEMTERMKELRREDYATDEEYFAALEEIANYHIQVEENLIQQARANVDRSRELYTENNLDASNWLIGFNSTMTEMGISYETPSNAATALKEALGNPEEGTGLYGDIVLATNQWEIDINQAMLDAGSSMSNFANTAAIAMYGSGGSLERPTGGAIKSINDTKSSITTLETEASNKFGAIAIAVSNWQKQFSPDVEAGTNQVTALYNSLKLLKDNYANTDVKVNVSIPGLETFNQFKEDLEELESKVHTVTTNYVSNYSSNYSGSTASANQIVTTETQGDRTYYKTASGQWYSQDDVNLEIVDNGDGTQSVQGKNGGVVSSYGDNMMNLLRKYESSEYAYAGKTGGDPSTEHVGLQITAEGPLTTYTAGAEQQTVDYYSSGYHPNILATGKARLINGGLYIWVYDAEDASAQGAEDEEDDNYNAGKNTSGGTYSWDTIVGSGKYVSVDDIQVGGEGITLRQKLQSLDTGGYTGDWGNEGRLAMLHQKEIVLNASDTENFLRAVEIVREIAGIIDLNAQAASFGLGNINASAVQNHNQTIEQEVTIHAEFPNATNHSEIEEAFNNLINTASQYANRKNR